MEKKRAKIEYWTIERELGYVVLRGSIVEHPLFNKGEIVKTSPLESVDFQMGIAVTRNTIYELA